jgi:hypothetical protein
LASFITVSPSSSLFSESLSSSEDEESFLAPGFATAFAAFGGSSESDSDSEESSETDVAFPAAGLTWAAFGFSSSDESDVSDDMSLGAGSLAGDFDFAATAGFA